MGSQADCPDSATKHNYVVYYPFEVVHQHYYTQYLRNRERIIGCIFTEKETKRDDVEEKPKLTSELRSGRKKKKTTKEVLITHLSTEF